MPFEKTKDMNPIRLSEYYRKSTEDTIRKYGFKVIANARENSAWQR